MSSFISKFKRSASAKKDIKEPPAINSSQANTKASISEVPQKITAPSKESKNASTKLSAPKIDEFKILQTLGTGSFGRVLLTRYRKTDTFMAIKILKKSEIIRLKQVEHTLNERNILTDVNHPFIVNLLGTFMDSGNLFMVLEYVPGGELFSYLRRIQVSISKFMFRNSQTMWRDFMPPS